MGSQSCSVFVGMIIIHIAMIVNFVALGTPNWIERLNNETIKENYTTQGLWDICVYSAEGKDCDKLASSQPAWYVAVQVIYTIGSALTFFTLISYYVLFIQAKSYGDTLRINRLALFLSTSACVCLIVAITLFGKWGVNEETELKGKKDYAWSYFTAIGGAVVTVLTAVIICQQGWVLRGTSRPYQDI